MYIYLWSVYLDLDDLENVVPAASCHNSEEPEDVFIVKLAIAIGDLAIEMRPYTILVTIPTTIIETKNIVIAIFIVLANSAVQIDVMMATTTAPAKRYTTELDVTRKAAKFLNSLRYSDTACAFKATRTNGMDNPSPMPRTYLRTKFTGILPLSSTGKLLILIARKVAMNEMGSCLTSATDLVTKFQRTHKYNSHHGEYHNDLPLSSGGLSLLGRGLGLLGGRLGGR